MAKKTRGAEQAAADKQLFAAIRAKKMNSVRAALDAGADVNARKSVGEYPKVAPLHLAILVGKLDMVKLLIERGAKVDGIDADGNTPLHYACGEMGLDNEINIEEVELLLTHGAPVDGKNNGNCTPLHSAVSSSARDVIELLLKHGADINNVSTFQTVLFEACKEGDAELFHYLLAKGANPKITACYDISTETVDNQWWWTLLHQAAQYDNLEVARFLLSHGADPKAASHGTSPLDVAKSGEMRALLGETQSR